MTSSEQARADCDYCDNGRFMDDSGASYTCGHCGREVLSSSDQARADALADAATLRLIAEELWDGERAAGSPFLLYQADTTRYKGKNSVASAVRMGRWARAKSIASEAARAAFRAVPGLRG